MKRLLSILLVSVLVFSVTATVYAAENSGGSSTINVAGEYSVASTGEVVRWMSAGRKCPSNTPRAKSNGIPARTPT